MKYRSIALWLVAASLTAASHAATPSVEVRDVEDETARVIRGYLASELGDCPADPPISRQAALEALTRTALDALGYFASGFTLAQEVDGACWRAVVTLTGGEVLATSVWHVHTEGALEEEPIYARRLAEIESVEQFEPSAYETSKRTLSRLAQNLGYLDMRYNRSEVLVDKQANTAAIHWAVDSGTRYALSPVTTDQDVLTDALFDRYLSVKDGDPYDSSALTRTYEDLLASDYFSQVRVEADTEQRADGTVPVTISAKPADRWSVLTGAGFATDTGPRVRARATARYLNPEGHRFNVATLVSPVIGDLQSEYRWPYGDPRHQWYSAFVHGNFEDTDTAESLVYGAGVQRTQRLGRRWTWTNSVNYRVEDYDVGPDEGVSQLLLFGTNLTYTTSVDTARPLRGLRVRADLRAAAETLGSDTDVVQLRLAAKQILPFIARTRLIVRGEIGHTWMDRFADLPSSLRFFAGGDESVRGFALDALGPEENGDVVGGRRLIAGSVEFDVPFRESWSAAVFTDVGSAFDDTLEFSQSVGVGVRWYSPVGPIRIDLAHPLEDSGQSVRLHVSIGPDL